MRVSLVVVWGGVFVALASPHFALPGVWVVAFVPLFIGLNLALEPSPPGARALLWRAFAATYPAGIVFAALTGGWVTNTAHVYGALPLPLGFAANALGFGSMFGLEFFAYLGLPFALVRKRPLWALAVVPLWCTVGQVFVPRFLFYTYGQVMITTPAMVQFADLLGSGGLNLLFLPLQLLLAFAACQWAPGLRSLPRRIDARPFALACSGVLILYALAFGYGFRQMGVWREAARRGPQVEVVGIQPNFSLGYLASNPALSHSDRMLSMQALIGDSELALARAQRKPGVPTVLVWPESVYPRAYFFAAPLREAVENWVRRRGVHLVLATQDAQPATGSGGRMKAFGAAVHVGPEGMVRGVYRKIALIPFGETIPLAQWFPAWARFLRAWIPQISEFTPGSEHTVFDLPNGVGLAPMICYDAVDETIARGMARNGARMGLLMANLAWFGRTSVSDQLGLYARFRAIENRMPLLFLSQNGESFMIDALGMESSARQPQFQKGAIVQILGVPEATSFYTRHGDPVRAGFALLLALTLLALPGTHGWRRIYSIVRERLSSTRPL